MAWHVYEKINWLTDGSFIYFLYKNVCFSFFQSNPYGLKESGPTGDMTAWTSAGLPPTTGYYPYDPTLTAYGWVYLILIFFLQWETLFIWESINFTFAKRIKCFSPIWSVCVCVYIYNIQQMISKEPYNNNKSARNSI